MTNENEVLIQEQPQFSIDDFQGLEVIGRLSAVVIPNLEARVLSLMITLASKTSMSALFLNRVIVI